MLSQYESYVVEAVLNYYNHDYDMFFEYLDEGVIWFGPKQGQYIVGKEHLMESLKRQRQDIEYRLENIETKFISFGSNVYTLVMSYRLYSKYPNGNTKLILQRVVVNGQKFRDRDGKILWRCPLIQVSNVVPTHSEKDFLALSSNIFDFEKEGKTIAFPGNNNSRVFINENSIKYIVGGKGVMSYIHTGDEVYTVRLLLKDISELLSDGFYRCHSSYIVNLRYVVYMSSHKITLDDKVEIPVSSKRYAQIKEDITAYITKRNN